MVHVQLHVWEDQTPQSFRLDGVSIAYLRCSICKRLFVQSLDGVYDWQAAYLTENGLEPFVRSVSDRWLSEGCLGHPTKEQLEERNLSGRFATTPV